MHLITEVYDNTKVVESLNESTGKKYYFIEGVYMQSNIKNRNGRMYPKHIMENEVTRYSSEKIANKTAYGELGHPAQPTINPERISHLIESLKWDGDNVIGRAKVLDTQYGQIAQKILEGGGRLGVSSRGMGSLKENNGIMEVQSDFYISTAADIVTDPSAPAAMVQHVVEGKEWFFVNGIWTEKQIEQNTKLIENKWSSDKEAVMLEVWNNILNSL